ncbi:MAG: tRNA (adenosine(37)-N6)-threonylcarbamoyltransferase complex ATPase subunit type 1 TsaE [Candidatus Muproteobacteria bacterium RBG_16_62_13]|uniref:tRNA threonylcarbamoyladenosine biosynthesis protein TsaE n=1 Tax=Candidatus Muproteobacteria bacterium RBG_16_62_13 TaxID=1817756 RepID=A0A1F6T1Z4_9PROT|nr:MAG: tRNA (adenosine(37)-N6)-threonylcarbamoyltransferase complex ATPase subunit type 1 TsaE [Candidatus Muproteobacteria bacterium RBG_16_62_13]
MRTIERTAGTPEAMEAIGAVLADRLRDISLATVSGPLGAGKTTLVRGLLRALGHAGAVKSPTFTLVESYPLDDGELHHFDLYRLQNPAELELIGWRDYLGGGNVCLVEWPERAESLLPEPDIAIIIDIQNGQRRVRMTALNATAEALLDAVT